MPGQMSFFLKLSYKYSFSKWLLFLLVKMNQYFLLNVAVYIQNQ